MDLLMVIYNKQCKFVYACISKINKFLKKSVFSEDCTQPYFRFCLFFFFALLQLQTVLPFLEFTQTVILK